MTISNAKQHLRSSNDEQTKLTTKAPSSPGYHRCKEVSDLRDHFLQADKDGNRLFSATTTYTDSPRFILTPTMAAVNLQRFYVSLLQTTVHPHNFYRPKYRPLQPVMYAFVDIPGSKRKRVLSPVLLPKFASDDFHHHFILIVKPEIADKFDDLCSHEYLRDQLRRLDPEAHIKTFHIRRIEPGPESVGKIVDYNSYYARNHRRNIDDADIILPISSSEFQQKPRARLR